MQVGETFIAVRPDTRGFGAELQSGVQGQAAAAGQGIGAELGGALSRGLATVVAGGAAVDFLRSAVTEASDLNEAVSLTGAVFQEAQQPILDLGEGAAESMGLANSEALNFADSIGGLFIGFGESRTEAAAMSENILQLGADLASAKNLAGGTGEALEILRSGLVGEVEPLRRIGVALNAASVEQRALADTGKTSADALTEGEKAAARYALIFESLSAQGVVGDFARTADQAANQQRIFNAELTNAKAEIGQQLLPAYIELIGAVRDGIPLLGVASEGLSSGASAAGLLAQALAPLVGLTTDVNEGIGNLTSGVADLNSAVPGLGQLTAILESAKAVFANGIDLGIGSIGSGGSPEIDFLADIEDGADGVRRAMAELNLEFGGDNRVTIEEWARAVGQEAADSGRSFEAVLDDLGISGATAAAILQRLGETGAATGQVLGELGAEAAAVEEAAKGGNLYDQADALREVADAADEARDRLEDLYGIQQDLDSATADVQATADDLTASLEENGNSFDVSTEAGRANLDAARAAASAIRDQTIAARANGASVEEAAGSNRFLTESLRRQLLQAGLSREETDRLIETYGRVPRRVLSTIEQNGASGVISAADSVKAALDRIPKNIQVSIGSNIGSVAASLSSLANQVQNLPPGLGPQGRSSSVDKGDTVRGGGVTINATGIGSPRQLAREIAPMVAREIDRKRRRD